MKYSSIERYKYRLDQDFVIATKIAGHACTSPFVALNPEGFLYIFTGYAWDGASGPAIDTKSLIRASLVHDALYQLMRLHKIPKSFKDYADDLLIQLAREDGCPRWRAWYIRLAVKYFGETYIQLNKG